MSRLKKAKLYVIFYVDDAVEDDEGVLILWAENTKHAELCFRDRHKDTGGTQSIKYIKSFPFDFTLMEDDIFPSLEAQRSGEFNEGSKVFWDSPIEQCRGLYKVIAVRDRKATVERETLTGTEVDIADAGDLFLAGKEVTVSDIKWDCDEPDDLHSLPTEVIVDVPSSVSDPEWIEDYISDWLSNEYNFCHKGFSVNTNVTTLNVRTE